MNASALDPFPVARYLLKMSNPQIMRLGGFAFITGLIFCAYSSQAQFTGLPVSGVNTAFLKLFGPHTNFSATADAQVLDKNGKDWVRTPLRLAALDQKIVVDLDMAKVVSRDLPDITRDSLKQSGMNQIVNIVRPDRRATYLIYPGAESYVGVPFSAQDREGLEKGYKIESTAAGKELLDGKERSKNKVIVRGASGNTVLEAITWNAPEYKGFPVQIQANQDNMTLVLRLRDIRLQKPDPAQFELPAGFTEYKDMQQMMFSIMVKIASGKPSGGQ
jgi:hypothetical protein